MKKLILLVSLVYANTLFSQVQFGIGVNQGFGALAAKNVNYSSPEKMFYVSNTRIGAFISIPVEENWHIDIYAAGSFLKDKSYWKTNETEESIPSVVNSSSTDDFELTFRNPVSEARSHMHTLNFSLMFSPSKYFSIGTGIGLDMHFSTYSYYEIQVKYAYNPIIGSHTIAQSEQIISKADKLFSPNLIIPIRTRLHLPINKFRISLENTIVLSYRNTYFQTGIFFGLAR
jgi:hypothetical protein